MPAPRHARPPRRRPFAVATTVALGAAAVAVPLAAQASPGAPKAPVEPAQDDAHVLHVALARVPAVRHPALPATVTVRPGDTLWKIAGQVCGDPADDLALAYNNGVPNPDAIFAGQVFKVACQAAAAAIAAAYPPPSPPASPPASQAAAPAGPPPAQQPAASTTTEASASGPAGSMQACIIAAESGGDSQVMNSTGHYGLYQFSEQTWDAHGGNPGDFGHASVAEQDQVYASTVAADGYSDWQPYDHC